MSTFHVDAIEIPQGNKAASPGQSVCCDSQVGVLTGVPLVKNSPRAPLGPSDVLIDGMPFSGMAMDRQKSAPASNEICQGQFTSPHKIKHSYFS
jgi:hypothetical protein